jgi:hypothetical protein
VPGRIVHVISGTPTACHWLRTAWISLPDINGQLDESLRLVSIAVGNSVLFRTLQKYLSMNRFFK